MKRAVSSIFLLFWVFLSQAQDLQTRLYQAGFENVQLKEEGDSLKIFFEHRQFRNPYYSLQYADLIASDSLEKELFWIPLEHNSPMGVYSSGDHRFSELSREDRRFFREHNSLSKGYRFSFRIHPDFAARFGYYSEPFQTKFNLILDTRLYLAKGLSLNTGISFPITNKLDVQDMSPRLAPTMLHYLTQPANGHFAALSLGSFYSDRYGLDLQYRYAPLDSRWSFGLESGYTGFYWLNAGSFYAEQLEDLYAVADVEYRLPFERLSLRVSAGQFLYEEKGGRVDLYKNFGRMEFGLHVAATQSGSTGGFQVAFALWPGKIFRGRKVELRTSEEFRWEYSYSNEAAVARKYRIGVPRLADMLRVYK